MSESLIVHCAKCGGVESVSGGALGSAHEWCTCPEPAQGGMIEPVMAMLGNGIPEMVYLSKGAEVKPAPGVTPAQIKIVWDPFMSKDELRAFIDERVRAVLEEDARAIRERKEFQPTKQAGICYVCLFSGDDMEWYESDGRSHLIHKNEECRRKAAEMPPTREHRG